MNKPLLIDVNALAELLSMSPATVRWYASVKPEQLPPRFKCDTKKLRWSMSDVERWVELRSNYKVLKPTQLRSGCNKSEATSDPCDQSLPQVQGQ